MKAFKGRYRNIMQALEILKNRGINHIKYGYTSYESWKLLSVINQKKEADIFVLDATFNIKEDFITKHDALFVKLSDADKVYKDLQQICRKRSCKLNLSRNRIYDKDWRLNCINNIEVDTSDPNKVIELSAKLNKHKRLLKAIA